MIQSITNIRPVGPGRLSFDVITGLTSGEEEIVMLADSKRIAFRLAMSPNERRRVTVRYEESSLTRIVLTAPASGLEVTVPRFDAETYGLQFKEPTPDDIVYCERCDEWHEEGRHGA